MDTKQEQNCASAKAKSCARSKAETVKDRVGCAAEKVKDVSGNLVDKAGDVLEDLADGTHKLADKMGGK